MPTLFYYYYCCCCCCSCCSCCCCAPAAEGRIVEIDFTKFLLLLKRPGIDIIHWQSKEHSLPAREHNDRCRGSGALSMLRLINGSKFHWNYCWQNCIFFLHSNSKDKFEQYKLKKSVDGVLGTRTRGAGWKAQTNPRSYGGTPQHFNFVIWKIFRNIFSYLCSWLNPDNWLTWKPDNPMKESFPNKNVWIW